MAQGLFKQMLEEKGIDNVRCDSAGISAFDGEAASENSIESMSEIGIDISSHRSKTEKKRSPSEDSIARR
jgi:protein-tyrosine-phosphatase